MVEMLFGCALRPVQWALKTAVGAVPVIPCDKIRHNLEWRGDKILGKSQGSGKAFGKSSQITIQHLHLPCLCHGGDTTLKSSLLELLFFGRSMQGGNG